jgi:hypothetical protein
MCNIKVFRYTVCEHSLADKIRCPQNLSRPKEKCDRNTYYSTYHGLCPHCSVPPTTSKAAAPATKPDGKPSESYTSNEETDDLTDLPSSRRGKAMASIRRMVGSVRRHAALRRKNSDLEYNGKQVEDPMDDDGYVGAAAPRSSEQLAEEYRSILDEHPNLQKTSFEDRRSPSKKTVDVETATTWSGVIASAIGQDTESGLLKEFGGAQIGESHEDRVMDRKRGMGKLMDVERGLKEYDERLVRLREGYKGYDR